MTLASISLKNFTVFEDARFDLCPGINVLLGANGTGKTHAMKAAYALLRPAPVSEETRQARPARVSNDGGRRLSRAVRELPDARYDVVLWLEEDLEREPAEREALVQRIEQRLRWLNPHVIIRDRATPLPGLSVRRASEEEIRSAEAARQH